MKSHIKLDSDIIIQPEFDFILKKLSYNKMNTICKAIFTIDYYKWKRSLTTDSNHLIKNHY